MKPMTDIHQPTTRLTLIDFLRGYSILTIVLFHILQRFELPHVLSLAINFGGAGIYVFMLCSGYGLYLSQRRTQLSYGEFLRKRFLKIYIPYALIILISSLFPFVNDGGNRLTAVLSHLLLFKMFNETYVNTFGEHFWFISMIIQFYLIFPLVFYLIERYRWKAVIGAFAVSLLWPLVVWSIGIAEHRVWNSFVLHFIWAFALGMMMAKAVFEQQLTVRIPPIGYLLAIAVIGIALTGITGIAGGIFKLYNDIPSAAGYLSFALLIYRLGITPINNVLIETNRFSYELYLVHMLMIDLVMALFLLDYLTPMYGVLALVVSLFIGYTYHLFLGRILSAFPAKPSPVNVNSSR